MRNSANAETQPTSENDNNAVSSGTVKMLIDKIERLRPQMLASHSSRYAGDASLRDQSVDSQASKDLDVMPYDPNLSEADNNANLEVFEAERARRAAVAEPKQRWKPRMATEGAAQGNLSFSYTNFGEFGKNSQEKLAHMARLLRRSPALVIGASEVQPEFEELLRQPSIVHETEEAKKRRLTEYSFKTVRHNMDRQACLIGVREDIGKEITSLLDEDEGNGIFHTRVQKKDKHSKTIIANIELSVGAAFFNKNLVCMCNHLNNEVAKAGWNSCPGQSRAVWLDKIVAYITKYKVDIIFGDYNMFLFHFFKHLRSCGIVVDVAAWFPWKTLDGTACVDTCCILIVNQRGRVKLCKGPDCLHDNDANGFYFQGKPEVDKDATEKASVEAAKKGLPANDMGICKWKGGFEVMQDTNRGYGKTLDEFKKVLRPGHGESIQIMLEEFLKPSSTQEQIDAAATERGTDAESRIEKGTLRKNLQGTFKRSCLFTREKRSDKNFILWQNTRAEPVPETQRMFPTGGHYPLLFFLQNNSNRSPQALEARAQNSWRGGGQRMAQWRAQWMAKRMAQWMARWMAP